MILSKNTSQEVDPDILIAKYLNDHRLNELHLVVPTNRLIRHLRKEFIYNSPGQYTGTINLDSIATLSEKIFRETHDVPGKEISQAAAMVLLLIYSSLIVLKKLCLAYLSNVNSISS